MSESYWHISRNDFFSQIAPEDIRLLESGSKIRKFKRSEPIYLPADAADGVMLLTSGRVKLCHLTREGKQSIFVFVEPGEIFGELAVVDPTQRDEYAEAVEASQIVLIPRDQMQWIMAKYPNVSLGITKLIGFRRKRIERRLKNLLFRSNRERLIYLILELVEQYGVKTDEGIELKIKLSHQDLANIIGSTRETVTVVLGHLQKEELLKIARRRLIVKNLEGLSEQVDESPVAIAPKETGRLKPPSLSVL